MKIDSASYSLASSHLSISHDEAQETLRAWKGDHRPAFESNGNAGASAVSLSAAARTALAADFRAAVSALPTPPPSPPTPPAPAPEMAAIEEASDAVDNDPFLRLIRAMVEMLTGQSIRIFSATDVPRTEALPSIADPKAARAVPPQAAAPRPAGFGIEYDYHAVHQEAELTHVSAAGTIKTADGREISFRLDLSMSRSYREETSLSLRAGDAVRRDPLVLNFNGAAARLLDQRFAFDLDGRGKPESLALLAGGSGYLAIDRNGNGKIDSGGELFGPATDSGFGELSALDSDRNGWIDENDLAFKALRIWTPETQGAGKLESLQQAKVGAIAVGKIASPFELRGAGNSNLGAIAASGVFLGEDGKVGTVQEVDLTV